jgi:hypothetical protein
MNESLFPDQTTKVFTEPEFDPHSVQRKIFLGSDQIYRGTCEADLICDSPIAAQAASCSEGYICDEETTLNSSVHHKCRGGYVCDFGTTPDPDLEAPSSQFKMLCEEGYYCPSGTGRGQKNANRCPADFFCPTGTAMPDIGLVASDSLVRNLSIADANPFSTTTSATDFGDADIRILSLHDRRCLAAVDVDSSFRYRTRWIDALSPSNNPSVAFLNFPRDDRLNADEPFRKKNELGSNGVELVDIETCDDTLNYTEANVKKYLRKNMTQIDENTWRKRCLARPSVIQRTVEEALRCGRDNKWRLIQDTIDRRECDCLTQTLVAITVYRFWKCKYPGTDTTKPFWYNEPQIIENQGLGNVDPFLADYHSAAIAAMEINAPLKVDESLNGGRSFWFKRGYPAEKRLKLVRVDGALRPLNVTDIGTHNDPTCSVNVASTMVDDENGFVHHLFNLSTGEIDTSTYMPFWSRQASSGVPVIDPIQTRFLYNGLKLRVSWDPTREQVKTFDSYQDLKYFVEKEFERQRFQHLLKPMNKKPPMDPYIYDLHRAIRLIEEYGNELDSYLGIEWRNTVDPLTLKETLAPFPKRLDLCDCERMLKCPNGTVTSSSLGGAQDIFSCVKTGEILRRTDVIPQSAVNYEWWKHRYDERASKDPDTGILVGRDMFLRNMTDFQELSGTENLTVGTLFLHTFETAVITLDLIDLAVNLTYNVHYRLAVYVDCKPCPTSYKCVYEQEPPTCTSTPSLADQHLRFDQCLTRHKTQVCMNSSGIALYFAMMVKFNLNFFRSRRRSGLQCYRLRRPV